MPGTQRLLFRKSQRSPSKARSFVLTSVLAGHANDQLLGLWLDPRPARASTHLRAIEAWTDLKTMASAVLFERQPFERIVLCRTVAAVLSLRSLSARTSSRHYQRVLRCTWGASECHECFWDGSVAGRRPAPDRLWLAVAAPLPSMLLEA
jgi:hypothetical protein